MAPSSSSTSATQRSQKAAKQESSEPKKRLEEERTRTYTVTENGVTTKYLEVTKVYRFLDTGDEEDKDDDHVSGGEQEETGEAVQANEGNETAETQETSNEGEGDGLDLYVAPGNETCQDPQYSTCQGGKRALLVGINYTGTSNELKGCVRDAMNMKNFLIEVYGFREENMLILTDDNENERFHPTLVNIKYGMQWLVKGAKPNDSYFFYYSGHGDWVEDEDGDEEDGQDEAICPVDCGENGVLTDDEMHVLLVKPLPAGCRLTALFDSCHSGTALDLPYVYTTKGTVQSNLFKNAARNLLSAGISYIDGEKTTVMESLLGVGKQMIHEHQINTALKRSNTSDADVISFAGCQDNQLSSETEKDGEKIGAVSHAFITTLRKNPKQTYKQLLNNIRDILHRDYSQVPQMSSSHVLDVNLPFVC